MIEGHLVLSFCQGFRTKYFQKHCLKKYIEYYEKYNNESVKKYICQVLKWSYINHDSGIR